jgi:hypothetical protein
MTRDVLERQAAEAWVGLAELDGAGPGHVESLLEEERLLQTGVSDERFFGQVLRVYLERGHRDELPVVDSRDPVAQALYVAHRLDGDSHALAEMLATRTPPGVQSDSTFMHGHCNGNQFQDCPAIGDYYRSVAAAAGVNVQGAVYKSGLARFPGDPEAWVRDRGDVRRLVESRGWGCEGDVNVKPDRSAVPMPDVAVAPDLVDQRVAQKIAANPDLARADQGELRHDAAQEIKPHWAA